MLTGDGKKNSVPEADEKSTGKQPSLAALPSITTAQPPATDRQHPQREPLPQRNSTKNVTAASAAVTGTAVAPADASNVTQSSALDDAHLQRTLLKPEFLTENSSTVVAQTGASSRISCLVANLGDCVVSDILHM